MTSFYDELGFHIAESRKKLKLSQRELARLIGIPASTLSNYENGYRAPSIEILDKISKVLGIELNELIGLKDADDRFNSYLDSGTDADFIEYWDKNGIRIDYYKESEDKNAVYIQMENGQFISTWDEIKPLIETSKQFFIFQIKELIEKNPDRFLKGKHWAKD